MAKTRAPYGSWHSPISTDALTEKSVSLGGVQLEGGDIYWTEGRPFEGGRTAVVRRRADGRTEEVTLEGTNARTMVHEYGGTSYMALEDALYYTEFKDQRIYRRELGARPRPITKGGPYRYAELTWDRTRRRLLAVREDHTVDVPARVVNTIVALAGEDGSEVGEILVSGGDFYSNPAISPDGNLLAWITWNHPNMPWDDTQLWVGKLDAEGHVVEATLVAGGPDESVVEPRWSPDGQLHFISDRTGYWNLYRWDGSRVIALLPREADFSGPAWRLGMSSYTFSWGGILAAFHEGGRMHLVHLKDGEVRPITLPYTEYGSIQGGDPGVAMVAAAPDRPSAVILLQEDGTHEVVKAATESTVDPAVLSLPEAISFPTGHDEVAYGFFYAPKNLDYEGLEGEKPPLLVFTHGGPTSAVSGELNLGIQWWTSRGFAVVDVNYRGSTGYGRAYRNALRGRWGVVDVEDTAEAARHLAKEGRVDGRRMAIRGGSAGGYTTLASLTFGDTFATGASYFGVSDIGALARETHKFESHYMDLMVGPWPRDQAIFEARSPLFHPELMKRPMILFQGLDDKIVPPNQAERMVEALKEKGIPVAYIAFPGEGHGFRKAETIKRATEAEYAFYCRIFGIPPAEPLEIPLVIQGLD